MQITHRPDVGQFSVAMILGLALSLVLLALRAAVLPQ